MEITLAVLADFASVSADGKLNVMGIFNQVNPRGIPARILAPYLVIHIEADIAEVDKPRIVRVELVDEDGHQMVAGEQTIVVRRPNTRVNPGFNLITRFPQLEFPTAGNYKFAIQIDGDHKADVPLRVNEPPSPDESEQE